MVDAATYTAIQQLQRAYGDVATRGAWDEVDQLLTPDAHITFNTISGAVFEIEGRDAFVEFAARMTGFVFYQYIPLSFVVRTGSDGALMGHTYSLEVAENEAGEWIESYGVYDDSYAEVDGFWLFNRRVHQTVKQRRTRNA